MITDGRRSSAPYPRQYVKVNASNGVDFVPDCLVLFARIKVEYMTMGAHVSVDDSESSNFDGVLHCPFSLRPKVGQRPVRNGWVNKSLHQWFFQVGSRTGQKGNTITGDDGALDWRSKFVQILPCFRIIPVVWVRFDDGCGCDG